MITNEVPTAMGIGSPPSRTSAGTNRNPPPAPINPVTMPTTRPTAAILASGRRCEFSVVAALFLRPRSIAMAVPTIITAKPTSSTVPGMNLARWPPV